jgi:hypothetical protein
MIPETRPLILNPQIQGIPVEAPTATHFAPWNFSVSRKAVNAFYMKPEVFRGLFSCE